MTCHSRPDRPCEVGCSRGWIECAIEDDQERAWVQMCDWCTSSGEADDELAARWAQQDTGLRIGHASAFPNGDREPFQRPYLGWREEG